jgi:glutaredoxin
MAHSVIVYSKSDCIFCQLAVQYLRAKGVDFVEREVNTHPQEWEEAKRLSGQDRLPVIIIDNKVIVGLNFFALEEALK